MRANTKAVNPQIFVHQIHLTTEEGDYLNKVGWTEAINKNPRIALYQSKNPTMEDINEYEVVAVIQGTFKLEDAFRIGNIGTDENDEAAGIELIDFQRRHSVSVGDIIEVDTGELPNAFFFVNDIGFGAMNNPIKERAG